MRLYNDYYDCLLYLYCNSASLSVRGLSAKAKLGNCDNKDVPEAQDPVFQISMVGLNDEGGGWEL